MTVTADNIREKITQITAAKALFEMEEVMLDGFNYRSYKHAPKTLVEVLQNGRAHGDIDYLVYEGRRYTYSDFYREVDAFAAALQTDFGVAMGDRVAIAMRNNPEWVIAYVAATLIGAIVVPVNSWGKTEELRYAISDSGSTLLICDGPRYKLIEPVLSELDLAVVLVDGESDSDQVHAFNAVVKAGVALDYTVADVAPEDHCVILYTSGSTGFPKGVVHRHIAVCQSLMNMFFLGMLVTELEGAREFRGGAEREAPMLTVPLFHATGLLSGLLLPLQMGHKSVMMYKWDSLTALKLIEQERVTGLSSVPSVLQELFNHPEYDKHDTSSLMRVAAAGAATPAGLPELIREKVGEPSRSTGWAMTETVAVGSTMSGVIYDLHPESAGLVSPLVDMRFVDTAGKEVPAGEVGEIEVYSVCCTPGYWEKPEANAATFDAQRWMKTGDIGRLDTDGYLHITGRIKEIVIRGGENIYPGEIENIAYEMPAVQENVVFGVPDEAMGEEMAMVVYVTPGEELSEADIRDYLVQRLAGYKVPRFIEISAQPLPQNASGKLHKLKVKEQFVNKH
ncbi:MAG: class I adenylate-forming enzyme family protein [Gammaproteobacteria bacterium]|nr:class I adenylate-forming enzyme family protein [Gammaproteobacteria bacterium]